MKLVQSYYCIFNILFSLQTFLLWPHFAMAMDRSSLSLNILHACEKEELLTATGYPKSSWLKGYENFIHQKNSPIYSFSQAAHLKKISRLLKEGSQENDFSEYWIARILFELNVDPLAHQIFQSLAEASSYPSLQHASQACMNQIHLRSPDWKSPLSDKDFIQEGIAEAKKHHLMSEIKLLTQGLVGLKRNVDEIHLLLGRAYYADSQYAKAITEFQAVSKTSNLEMDALSDLSWTYYQAKQFNDAVGIAMQFRMGLLKNTFAPEPLMVAAMILNELCLFPESIRMIQAFIKSYAKSEAWLVQNQNKSSFYPEIILGIKNQSAVPAPVLSEWIKSPAFQVRQKEINHLVVEPEQFKKLEKDAIFEQKTLTTSFIQHSQDFIKEVKRAQLKLKPGEVLAARYADGYSQLKKEQAELSHYYQASQSWKTLSRNYLKKIPEIKNNLISKINEDLKKKTKALLLTLEKVKESTDLIEIEIYNGASQDMIWKNAHPDFVRKPQTDENENEKPVPGKIWSWGRFRSSELEDSEIWEDEMGALKADLSNQCAQKEKYLKLK